MAAPLCRRFLHLTLVTPHKLPRWVGDRTISAPPGLVAALQGRLTKFNFDYHFTDLCESRKGMPFALLAVTYSKRNLGAKPRTSNERVCCDPEAQIEQVRVP